MRMSKSESRDAPKAIEEVDEHQSAKADVEELGQGIGHLHRNQPQRRGGVQFVMLPSRATALSIVKKDASHHP